MGVNGGRKYWNTPSEYGKKNMVDAINKKNESKEILNYDVC
jgi:hypothetical protein